MENTEKDEWEMKTDLIEREFREICNYVKKYVLLD